MNKYSSFILIILFFSCKGHQNNNKSKFIDTSYSINKDRIVQEQNKTFLELYITEYIDSINNATKESELPNFLKDSQFDYNKRSIWDSPHNPISVREQIINRVTNCKSLQLVINSKNKSFRVKPNIEDNLTLPLIEWSFYDLMLKRFNALNCK